MFLMFPLAFFNNIAENALVQMRIILFLLPTYMWISVYSSQLHTVNKESMFKKSLECQSSV